MKQILLAATLIALPVGVFTAYTLVASQTTASATTVAAGLGDLSAMRTIVTDTQTIAAKGDFAGAKARIKDFELTWDDNEKGLKPLDGVQWHLIDDAADTAFTEIRASKPDQAAVNSALAALSASLGAKS